MNTPIVCGSTINEYINKVNAIPMLSYDEEMSFAGDVNAAQSLILAHLKYVVKITRNYVGYGLPQEDLIQEGNIGLMKAVKRFDPQKMVRLSTFAMHWIKAEIHEFILKNWKIVKIATTKAQRKLFFNLRKMKKSIGWMSDTETNSMAEELNVKKKDVLQMEARLQLADSSFDNPIGNDEDDMSTPAHYIKSDQATPEQILNNNQTKSNNVQMMTEALNTLKDRNKDIITQRWLNHDKVKLNVLAEKYNISVERVRQIEHESLTKLRKLTQQKKSGL